jgi:acyl carrier protein
MKSDVGHLLRRFIGECFLAQQEPWSGPEDISLRDSGVLVGDTEVIELVGFLEKTFDIDVLDDEIHRKNLDTLRALTAYVNRKMVSRALANVASRATSRPRRGLGLLTLRLKEKLSLTRP